MNLKHIFCAVLLFTVAQAIDQLIEEEEIRAQTFIDEFEEEMIQRRNLDAVVNWDYASNITDYNEKRKNEVLADNTRFAKEKIKEVRTYSFQHYKNADLKRQFKKASELGYAALSSEKYLELLNAITAMESNFAKVRICSFKNQTKCDLQLEPEITAIFEHSDDPEELKYYWQQWYDHAGKPVRSHFDKYIALKEEAAKLNNYTDAAAEWLDVYEDSTFEQQLDSIFDEIRPLYQQIHAYVRFHLRQKYGDIVPEKGSIPMHLLGNMWAQSWDNVAKFTKPYPNKPLVDVTDEMIRQNYTALRMFQMGDEFFQSLNMTALPPSFWEKSIIEKPTDGRDLICHASAWDFYLNNDVRIKQCTRITMDDFSTVHHELGHIQYYLQYQNQPLVYRDGANPGFHEAVGDVLSLSVETPKHLEKIGLLKNYEQDDAGDINQLYQTALKKIVFLPFAFTLDKYRWGIFRGDIKQDEYNCRFWKLRQEYSGIQPPVQRSENDFDAAAKYHISADVEYLRYLVSFIIQFQFHKGVCIKAGEYAPDDPSKILSHCDIYQSTKAGNALKEMLSLGSSLKWHDAIEILTDQRKMEASPLLEYFKPLHNWLEAKNKEIGAHVGWDDEYECVKSK